MGLMEKVLWASFVFYNVTTVGTDLLCEKRKILSKDS